MDDYSQKYDFTIKATHKGKPLSLFRQLDVGDLFDDKGYLHRYLVKEML